MLFVVCLISKDIDQSVFVFIPLTSWWLTSILFPSQILPSVCFSSWGHYETLSMWRYTVLLYYHLKFLTSNERVGSLFPSLMIIPYIYLLFSSENLTISTMSPNWSRLSFLLPVCLRISSNYTLRVVTLMWIKSFVVSYFYLHP